MYSLLCDIFAQNHTIFLKPHPGDVSDYSQNFKKQVIIPKELPSELIRFMFDKKIDIGICTFSSSVHSLIPFIGDIYNIDETIVDFKNRIFKPLILFELAKELKLNIELNKDSLSECFSKLYSLKGDVYLNYYNANSHSDMIVKNEYFKEANIVIAINKTVKKSNLIENIQNGEKLYMRIECEKLKEQILNFKYEKLLKVSETYISIYLQAID